jgi:hypothetical protein
MDTRMHEDAMPGADRRALARPSDVALRVVGLLAADELPPSGTRLELAALDRVA